MVVVSDTTVLIALGRIGLLWLLERLWCSVIIPEAVYQEVLKGLHGSREITEAVNLGWLQIKSVNNQKMVRLLQGDLRGRGECECIVLAEETGAKAILTDDKKARKVALSAGVEVAGTLGLLVRATKEGILTKQEAIDAVESLIR
ncbi:MAG: DUF3368 domain-containing protein [Thermoanaerobacter sp.]|nr:DUF3368 domain-containing protein [Thermoanaerobacter sp.]